MKDACSYMNGSSYSPINTPYVEINGCDQQDSESTRLLFRTEMIDNSESNVAVHCRHPVYAYKTFDSEHVNNEQLLKQCTNVSVYSESSESCQPCSTYSPANSHEIYGILSEKSDKMYSKSTTIPMDNTLNFEIANSHSNYEIYYNRPSSFCGPTDKEYSGEWSVDRNTPEKCDKRRLRSSSSSFTSEEFDLSACDIEQCLMQIEESLLNIEQNLRHVQNLEIPQLNSLLSNRFIVDKKNCKKLRLTRSASDDWPFSRNIKGNNAFNNTRLSHSDNDINVDKRILFNEVKNLDVFSSRKSFLKKSETLLESNFEKLQFLKEIETNITNCHNNNSHKNNSDNSEVKHLDTEKKPIFKRKKNFLDDKRCFTSCKKRKTSLNNYFSKNNGPVFNRKILTSQGTLEKYARESFKSRKKKREAFKRSMNCQTNDCLFNKINAKAIEFREKLETLTIEDKSHETCWKEQGEVASTDKTHGERFSSDNNNHRDVNIDKKLSGNDNRKQKYFPNKMQSSDNAIVPRKLLSLSFSLLLAALLQAVRCLADIVEDTFRSVTLDKYALHE